MSIRAHRARTRAARHRRLRRRRPGQAGRATPRRRTSWSPPPVASRTCSRAARSRSTRSGCSSSTRPTGCSTWAFARRSTGSSPPARQTRQTLFFSATLDGEAGRVAAHYTHDAAHPRARAEPGTPREHRRRAPLRRSRARAPRRGAGRRARSRARPARSCSCAPSAEPTGSSSGSRATASRRVAMHGNKSQRQREQALASFESGCSRHAGRHRRRRARNRRRGHLARDQLRPAGGPRDLRPPHRPHRPRRRARASASRSSPPTSITRSAGSPGDSDSTTASAAPDPTDGRLRRSAAIAPKTPGLPAGLTAGEHQSGRNHTERPTSGASRPTTPFGRRSREASESLGQRPSARGPPGRSQPALLGR